MAVAHRKSGVSKSAKSKDLGMQIPKEWEERIAEVESRAPSLSPKQEEFILKNLDNYTYKNLAYICGCTLGQVKYFVADKNGGRKQVLKKRLGNVRR